jgi:hypothetical protein
MSAKNGVEISIGSLRTTGAIGELATERLDIVYRKSTSVEPAISLQTLMGKLVKCVNTLDIDLPRDFTDIPHRSGSEGFAAGMRHIFRRLRTQPGKGSVP